MELDSSDGMILGQHLYLTVAGEDTAALEGVTLGSSFLCYDEDGNCYVWADDGQGKLEQRTVELGSYDGMNDVYEILSGLSESDYVAFPDEEICVQGAPTTKTQQEGGKNQ